MHLQVYQLLEGPDAAVKKLLSKIQEDNRHTDVKVLQAEIVAQRVFPSGMESGCADEDSWGYITSDTRFGDDDAAR